MKVPKQLNYWFEKTWFPPRAPRVFVLQIQKSTRTCISKGRFPYCRDFVY